MMMFVFLVKNLEVSIQEVHFAVVQQVLECLVSDLLVRAQYAQGSLVMLTAALQDGRVAHAVTTALQLQSREHERVDDLSHFQWDSKKGRWRGLAILVRLS